MRQVVEASMIIYKATNTVNGKLYIGQTSRTLAVRIRDHLRGRVNHGILGNAIRKYGLDRFTFEVIDKADTKPELDAKETMWITHYDCKTPKGYNLTNGGEGNVGYRMPESVRAKISAKARGRRWTEEAKRKVSQTLRSIEHSPEVREGWAKTMIARNKSEKARRKSSAHMTEWHRTTGGPKGSHHTEETLAKMTEVKRQFWNSEAGAKERERRRTLRGTYHMSDATRKHLSEARKLHFTKIGRPPVSITCITCGKIFTVINSRSTAKYCSLKCWYGRK
jgi:group I intron endonuclease